MQRNLTLFKRIGFGTNEKYKTLNISNYFLSSDLTFEKCHMSGKFFERFAECKHHEILTRFCYKGNVHIYQCNEGMHSLKAAA